MIFRNIFSVCILPIHNSETTNLNFHDIFPSIGTCFTSLVCFFVRKNLLHKSWILIQNLLFRNWLLDPINKKQKSEKQERYLFRYPWQKLTCNEKAFFHLVSLGQVVCQDSNFVWSISSGICDQSWLQKVGQVHIQHHQ